MAEFKTLKIWKLLESETTLSIVSKDETEFIMAVHKSTQHFELIKDKFERIVRDNNKVLAMVEIGASLFSSNETEKQ